MLGGDSEGQAHCGVLTDVLKIKRGRRSLQDIPGWRTSLCNDSQVRQRKVYLGQTPSQREKQGAQRMGTLGEDYRHYREDEEEAHAQS